MLVHDVRGDPAQPADAVEWRDTLELPFDVLADSHEIWLNAWGDPDAAVFVQHSYTVLNADGTVAWHDEGYERDTTLATIIEEALAATPAEP